MKCAIMSPHEQSFCCPPDGPGRQQTNRGGSAANCSISAGFAPSLTQTTLSSPRITGPPSVSETGFGFDILSCCDEPRGETELVLEKQQASGCVAAIFRAITATVTYTLQHLLPFYYRSCLLRPCYISQTHCFFLQFIIASKQFKKNKVTNYITNDMQ